MGYLKITKLYHRDANQITGTPTPRPLNPVPAPGEPINSKNENIYRSTVFTGRILRFLSLLGMKGPSTLNGVSVHGFIKRVKVQSYEEYES